MKKDDLSKIYQSYKFYIFPVIVALSSLFLIVFAIYPQTMKLINNQKSAGDLDAKSEFFEAKVSALESVDLQDLSKKVDVALGAFPADKDLGNMFGLLQQIISQSGFSISSIAISGGGGAVGSSQSFGMKLDVKGNRALFQTLLSNLESAPRLMRVTSIDTSSGKFTEGLEASLNIDVLYSAAPKSYGSTDSPLPQITQQEEDLLASLIKLNTAVSRVTTSSQKGKANPFE